MSVRYEKPASIYCASAQVYSKKPSKAGLQSIQGIGLCIRYRCERNSEAIIVKEASVKPLKHDKKARTRNGDSIEDQTIDVYVNGLKSIDINKIGSHTSRHSTQSFQTNVLTYATLIQPFVHIQNAIENRRKLETVENKKIDPKRKSLPDKK